MKITDYPAVKASDLTVGSILGSGEIVESIATGGKRYGDTIYFTFRSGKTTVFTFSAFNPSETDYE